MFVRCTIYEIWISSLCRFGVNQPFCYVVCEHLHNLEEGASCLTVFCFRVESLLTTSLWNLNYHQADKNWVKTIIKAFYNFFHECTNSKRIILKTRPDFLTSFNGHHRWPSYAVLEDDQGLKLKLIMLTVQWKSVLATMDPEVIEETRYHLMTGCLVQDCYLKKLVQAGRVKNTTIYRSDFATKV